jgi:arginine-tRNA-protein transferase
VYFLYHESIHKYAPGKLGAMHEIALASEEGYRWWYPGFYIHNCPKMKYKIDYSPQFILDPDSLRWDPLDQTVLGLLDHKPFLSLSLERQNSSVAEGSSGGDGQRDLKRPRIGKQDNGTKDATVKESINSHDEAEDKVGDHEEDEDEDDDEDIGSLFRSNMPGIKSVSEMLDVDLDHIALKVFPVGPLVETSDLVAWDAKSITDWPGIKASVAELVAAIGPDTIESICLDMARDRG